MTTHFLLKRIILQEKDSHRISVVPNKICMSQCLPLYFSALVLSASSIIFYSFNWDRTPPADIFVLNINLPLLVLTFA